MKKVISISIKSDFGLLKKPDTNDPMYLTFNMLHKPALLGILGAIVGEKGFQEYRKLPDYYKKFKDLKVSIAPLEEGGKLFHDNGNFVKTVIKYSNTTGLANEDGTLIVTEQSLVSPAFKCWILIDTKTEIEAKLYTYLKNNQAEYLPYMGKNEFSLWWDNFTEYDFDLFVPTTDFKIYSLFIKEETLKDGKVQTRFQPGKCLNESKYSYFERLPVGYNEDLFQYEYRDFVLTNWNLKQSYSLPDSYRLYILSNGIVIQLF
jgi:CRISPR-associated protein Cas5h